MSASHYWFLTPFPDRRIGSTPQAESTPRRGYVLLAVIAVLVLMVTVLATLSKLSLKRALAAADARIRLQQKIGSESIESALLPRAAAVFDQLESLAEQSANRTAAAPRVPHQLRSAVTIGGVTFDVVLSDEDAKLNLNQVYHAAGLSRTQRTLDRMIGPSAARVVRLRPAVPPTDDNSIFASDDEQAEERLIPRAFRSWGEVFDLESLRSVYGSDAALPNLTGNLSCWGSGGLNVARASDASIRAAASCVLSEAGAGRLVSRYRENPATTIELLILQETNTETERMRMRRMLSSTSTHFSLWIDASTNSRRSSRSFSVMRLTDDGVTVNERFAF